LNKRLFKTGIYVRN